MMRSLFLALAAWSAGQAMAQDPPPDVMTRQHGGAYVTPPSDVNSAYVPEGPDGFPRGQGTGSPLHLELSLDVPLRGRNAGILGAGSQGARPASPTVQALLRWTPLPGQPWFAQAVFYGYLQGDRQQPWNPDYSYAFGYDDGRPDTWHLVYGNYTGTRWRPHPEQGEGRFNVPEGQWTVGRRFPLPRFLQPWLLVGDGDLSTCNADLHFTPRYEDFASAGRRSGKTSVSLGCLYVRPSGWFGQLELFAYPQGSQQQPWDPDFTYGFGWRGTQAGTLSLRYSNYSGNRLPWRHTSGSEGRFDSGSISLSWSLPW